MGETQSPSQTHVFVAGCVAGVAVDCILYPLDTIKTRIQSQSGFRSAGGFSRIYSGIASSLVGSAPTAALFFLSYEGTKKLLKPICRNDAISQMTAASVGECVACSVRVPVEVVKQRTQAKGSTSWKNLALTVKAEGLRGLYRGYGTTIAREIPFSLIQFPLWEYLKLKSRGDSQETEPWKASICGMVAGGTSAFITTPLDVAKTRVILAERNTQMAQVNVAQALRLIWIEKGLRGLFAGAIPRVLWISIGGAIFLGGYSKTLQVMEHNFN